MRLPKSRIALLAVLALAPLAVPAASLTVNPIRLEMAAGARATSLTVTNQAEEPALLQATVYRWTHDHGEDVLTEVTGADAPIVTPPLFKLPGSGASQVVRIGFRSAPTPGEEQRWRVIVEEVPKPAPIPDGIAAPQTLPVAVSTRLRLSMPLLLAPAVVRKDLAWSLVEATQGLVSLSVENRGSVTERFDQIALAGADPEHPLATLSGPIYLFPSERRSFTLKPNAGLPKGALRLSLPGTAKPSAVELARPGS
jgi:fimbrial chaperone protein